MTSVGGMQRVIELTRMLRACKAWQATFAVSKVHAGRGRSAGGQHDGPAWGACSTWSSSHACCRRGEPNKNACLPSGLSNVSLQEGDAELVASVGGMQRVIELARTLRERRAKPLKQPLARLVVVHPDPGFLADLDGRLRAYILSEVSHRTAVT